MNKHITLLTLVTLFLFNLSKAECVLVPLKLDERVSSATLIIEAKVVHKSSYWNNGQTMISTANTVAISKIYKGLGSLSSNNLNIITLGGTINDRSIKAEPELELEVGEVGIFLLINKNGEWVSESGPQGFIKIDKMDGSATDIFNQYPPFTIYSMIENLTGIPATIVNGGLTKVSTGIKRATATITSISPKTINAGTTSTLTIKGTNFKSVRDTSSVMFKNGDDGGLSYVKAMKYDYISWSDTMIKLIVRTKAGTGKIRVVISGNSFVTSTDTLTIAYSHLNVVSGDSVGFETQEIGMNATNGITWKLNKGFYDSIGAKGAFIRSLERWRCGTFMNWDTLGKVNYSKISSDGVNLCAWDTSGAMPSGVLAQCFSFWSGCVVGTTLKWFVNEMDIRFRMKPTTGTNWNYSAGSASTSEYHFESVATHELGHGHQLGHVIAPSVVMHYSIANGSVKPSLTASDIAGGTYVITKSATAICGKNAHSKLNSGNCAIVPPVANFTMNKSSVCLNETLTFADSSKGNITAYSWNFGAGAIPATANTIGPHSVKYSTGGTKSITLTITTSTSATLLKTKNLTVKADAKMKPDFTYVWAEKGKVTFTNKSNNSTSDKWYFGDSDSSSLASPVHSYTAGGSYNVTLFSTNTCNTEDTIKSISFIYCDTFAFANFSYGNYGNNLIGFTNHSNGSNKTFKWYFGDGDSSNLMNPLHQYTNSNNKVVRLVVTGPCNVDDTTITMRDFTGLDAIVDLNLFSIYPNPVSHQFNILSPLNSVIEYSVTDLTGKVVMNSTTSGGENKVNAENIANGIYMVKMTANGHLQTIKLVVQH